MTNKVKVTDLRRVARLASALAVFKFLERDLDTDPVAGVLEITAGELSQSNDGSEYATGTSIVLDRLTGKMILACVRDVIEAELKKIGIDVG